MTEKKIQVKKNKAVKVPVILQMEALECGAASLAMILAYYKKWVPLEQVRSDCGVSRDGSKASNIVKAAKAYGLDTKAHRCGIEFLKTKTRFPAIIHWNFNHFVVLNGFKGEKAVLNDPARGTVVVSAEEFDRSFTGVCVQFEPGESFEPGGKPESTLNFAKKRLKGAVIPVLFVMASSFLISFSGILEPVFKRIFTDAILPGESRGWLGPFMLGMIFLIVFKFIANTLNSVYLIKLKGKLSMVSNAQFMWHTLRLPMEFFSQRMAGDLARRQKENDEVAETLISKLAPGAINVVLVIFYFVVMIRYSVLLTMIGLTAILLNMFLANLISGKRINITRTQMRDEGKLQAMTVTGIEMIESIKSSGAENGFFERWSGTQAAVNKSQVSFSFVNQFLGAVPELLQEFTDIIILAIGVFMIIKGEFTVGMLTAFQAMLASFLQPMNSLIDSGQKFQEMRSSMERIEDVMKYPANVKDTPTEEVAGIEFDKLSGSIEMKNVTFGYSKLSQPLLKDFSMSLKPGSKVAFVGFSGCGKSTLTKLISGLYEPWSGEILFDGKPRSAYPREVFTGSLTVVDQDITLFEDSIAGNLKMWDETVEDFEMILAARDAQIHEDIMQREEGYQTEVAEGGRNFSGGQRQRFEIARVLAQDPTIVILDEATSALDAATEYKLTKAIKDRGVTCIIVAHRLSTIRDCDEIIVLDRGEVAERGTHEELYAKNGLYTKLVTTE